MTIIPQPKNIEVKYGKQLKGIFGCTNAEGILSSESLSFSTDRCEIKEPATGGYYYYAVLSDIPIVTLPVFPDQLTAHEDGFQLIVNDDFVSVQSLSQRGVLYGWNLWKRTRGETEKGEDGAEKFLQTTVIDYPDSDFRGFHMDMRFGFPSFDRLCAIINELSELRFNYFMIEYENRFPYPEYQDIADKQHYTEEEIRALLKYAAERYIEVIPLQQTIGHLEYFLKLPRYNHLREVRQFPETEMLFGYDTVGFKHFNDIDEICASNEDAYLIVESMLKGIIAAHPDSRYIHLGCDEAWNLLTCDDCISNYGIEGRNKLYLTHINRMAEIVSEAGRSPVIWDDMLRSFTDEELALLDKRIVIMIWLYYESNYDLAKELCGRFRNAGFKVLGAAAAKCGEGPEPQYLDMPWYQLRIGNVDMWGRVCAEEKIPGFCMTVWSNYSGTIAPPHPFFDTVWYPVSFASDKSWNHGISRNGADERFVSYFWGVDGIKAPFKGSGRTVSENLKEISERSLRHRYEARAMYIMALLSVYRLKSLAVGRELFKLEMDVTEAERTIVRNRANEVREMREYLKPLVRDIVSVYYTDDDAEVFSRSRFDADEVLYDHFLGYQEMHEGV